MKLTKETTQQVLRTSTLDLSEEEIRFVFHIFDFDLKEFQKEIGRIRFEVHHKVQYIARIELTSTDMVFSNEWLNFGDGNEHGLAMPLPKCLGEILVMFVNVFSALIPPAQWIDNSALVRRNIFESEKEAEEYLNVARAAIADIVKPYNKGKK